MGYRAGCFLQEEEEEERDAADIHGSSKLSGEHGSRASASGPVKPMTKETLLRVLRAMSTRLEEYKVRGSPSPI